MKNSDVNTALLVMDMQEMILQSLSDTERLINNTKTAIEHALRNNIPIIYVVVGFRKNFDEIDSNNKSFGNSPLLKSNISMEQWMKIYPSIAPEENDIIVVKRRFSAFAGSDLDIVLRAKNIKHLVLCGVATSGAVLSTTIEAADKDFQLTILSDVCQDRDDSVHQFLMEKIFPKYAEISHCQEWVNQE